MSWVQAANTSLTAWSLYKKRLHAKYISHYRPSPTILELQNYQSNDQMQDLCK